MELSNGFHIGIVKKKLWYGWKNLVRRKINDKSQKYRSCQYYYGKLQVDDSLVPTDVMYGWPRGVIGLQWTPDML